MTFTDAVEILKAVDKWFDSPERWMKGAYGRDKEGKLYSLIENREKWECTCLLGAIAKCNTGRYYSLDSERALEHTMPKNSGLALTIDEVNDRPEMTFLLLKQWLARAIKYAKKRAKTESLGA